MFTSGRLWAYVHGIGVVIWTALCWPGLTSWRNSIEFVVFMSLYNVVLTHLVGWVSALAARKADPNDPT